jgi:hypothetical protein
MTILMGKSAIYDLSCFEEEVQHMEHWPNQQGHNSFIMAIKEHVIRRDIKDQAKELTILLLLLFARAAQVI